MNLKQFRKLCSDIERFHSSWHNESPEMKKVKRELVALVRKFERTPEYKALKKVQSRLWDAERLARDVMRVNVVEAKRLYMLDDKEGAAKILVPYVKEIAAKERKNARKNS